MNDEWEAKAIEIKTPIDEQGKFHKNDNNKPPSISMLLAVT